MIPYVCAACGDPFARLARVADTSRALCLRCFAQEAVRGLPFWTLTSAPLGFHHPWTPAAREPDLNNVTIEECYVGVMNGGHLTSKGLRIRGCVTGIQNEGIFEGPDTIIE